MSACLNACGSSPAASEAVKIAVRDGAKIGAYFFSKRPGIPSAPVALRPGVDVLKKILHHLYTDTGLPEKTGTVDVAPVRVHWCNGSQSLQSEVDRT